VQICLGLLKPYRVLLCDEITVDLDVCARVDLLAFFKRETEQRGATIIYATHIFDGMDAWPTHVAYVERGVLKRAGRAADVPVSRPCCAALSPRPLTRLVRVPSQEMFAPGEVDGKSRLLATMEAWLRAERDDRVATGCKAPGQQLSTPSPFASSKHMAYYR
jgi:CCR4-NOT complex subunit CAF16